MPRTRPSKRVEAYLAMGISDVPIFVRKRMEGIGKNDTYDPEARKTLFHAYTITEFYTSVNSKALPVAKRSVLW